MVGHGSKKTHQKRSGQNANSDISYMALKNGRRRSDYVNISYAVYCVRYAEMHNYFSLCWHTVNTLSVTH